MDKSKSNLYGAQSSKINSRILNEIKNLQTHPSPLFHAAPMENDMHVWHFTLRGYPESVFSRGLYHGVIKLPKEYPLKAPDIQFFTPNGRFKVNTNICLSASGFHPESWTPLWKVRNLVEAIGAFMLSEDAGIGRVDSSDAQKKLLAEESRLWSCKQCSFLKKEGDLTKPIIMEEIEKHYMVDTIDWSVNTQPIAGKLFGYENKPQVEAVTTNQAEIKPVVQAEAQPGILNPPVQNVNDKQLGAAYSDPVRDNGIILPEVHNEGGKIERGRGAAGNVKNGKKKDKDKGKCSLI